MSEYPPNPYGDHEPETYPSPVSGASQPPGSYGPPSGQAPQPQGNDLPAHPRSTTVLILGVISILACSLLGPFAWFMGSKARKEVRENPGLYREDSTLTAGWITGIIGTVFLAVGIVIFAIVMVFVFALGTNVIAEAEKYDRDPIAYCEANPDSILCEEDFADPQGPTYSP